MTHLPFTLTAYFFNALAVLTSKFLLSKSIPDPLIYIFYISIFSFLATLALPFTKIPSSPVFILASVSTLLWTLGAYFMFKALKLGQISRVIPIVGTLIPLILLAVASYTQSISSKETLAVWFLTSGMVFLTISDWRFRVKENQGGFSKKELIYEVLSALFFATSYILLREAYLRFDFFSVLVWSRLILLPLGVIMFAVPLFRKKIITSNGSRINFLSKEGLVFLGGQASGAVSELLILFSISLANPALVNSLQGTQYIFLLIFALLLSKRYPTIFQERLNLLIIIPKVIGIVLVATGFYLLAFSS